MAALLDAPDAPPLRGVFRPPRTAATALANIVKASDRLREALLRCSASTADTCSAGSLPGTPTRTLTLTLTLALALTLALTLTDLARNPPAEGETGHQETQRATETTGT